MSLRLGIGDAKIKKEEKEKEDKEDKEKEDTEDKDVVVVEEVGVKVAAALLSISTELLNAIMLYLNTEGLLKLAYVIISSDRTKAILQFSRLIVHNDLCHGISSITAFAQYGKGFYTLACNAKYRDDICPSGNITKFPFRAVKDFLKCAVEFGNLRVLRDMDGANQLRDGANQDQYQEIFEYAVTFGELNVLKWVLSLFTEKFILGDTYCQVKAKRVQTRVFMYLVHNGYEITKNLMFGIMQIEDVEFFANSLNNKLPTESPNEYFEVPCLPTDSDKTLEILHFLFMRVHTCKKNSLQIFNALSAYYTKLFGPLSKELIKDIVIHMEDDKKFELLKLLHVLYPDVIDNIAYKVADAGNFELLKWLHSLRPDVIDIEVFEHSMLCGISGIEWLLDLDDTNINHPIGSSNNGSVEQFRAFWNLKGNGISELEKKFTFEEIIEIFKLFLERGHIFDNLTIYDIAEHASVDLILWLTNCIDDVHIKASSKKCFYNIDWELVFMGAIKGKNIPMYTWILDNKLSDFSYESIVDTDYYECTVVAIEQLLMRERIDSFNSSTIMGLISDVRDLENDNFIHGFFNDWDFELSSTPEIELWYIPNSNAVSSAIFNNCLRAAIWLMNCGCKFSVNQCIYYAIQLGRLPILVYLKEYTDMVNAAGNANNEVGNMADDAAGNMADDAAGNAGNAEGDVGNAEGDVGNAAGNADDAEDYDDTPHIKDCWLNPDLCNIAAYYGHLEVLDWLIHNDCRLNIQACIEIATNACVLGSRYDIISYLLRLQKQLEK
jgi:hypothetical protein